MKSRTQDLLLVGACGLKISNSVFYRKRARMLERVRTMGAREPRTVLSLEQNAIQYTIPYVRLELALPLSCSQ